MKQHYSDQAGFSMVELLVAVVILAIGLLGLAELQVSAIKTNAHSDAITVARSLAQLVVEEIAAMDAGEAIFATDTTSAQNWDNGSSGTYAIAGAGDYVVTYEVDADYQGVDGLSQVTVHVSSSGFVSSVLGNRVQQAEAITFKRSF